MSLLGNKATTVAAVVAVSAISLILVLVYRSQRDVRVVETVFEPTGPVTLPIPSVRVRLSIPEETSRSGERTEFSFRVVSNGRTLPTLTTSSSEGDVDIHIPLGYAQRIDKPMLEVFAGGRLRIALRLDPLPKPQFVPLAPKPHPSFRLVALRDEPIDSVANPALKIVPRKTLLRGETWRAQLVRTSLVPSLDLRTFGTGNSDLGFVLPYATQSLAAEVIVNRLRTVNRVEELPVPNLRIVRSPDGKARISVPPDTVLTTSLGDKIRLLAAEHGPGSPRSQSDDPHVSLTFGTESSKNRAMRIQLASPSPDELGVKVFALQRLRGHQLSLHWSTFSKEVLRPLRREPFTAVLRISAIEDIPLETIRACVPIERPRGMRPFQNGISPSPNRPTELLE